MASNKTQYARIERVTGEVGYIIEHNGETTFIDGDQWYNDGKNLSYYTRHTETYVINFFKTKNRMIEHLCFEKL